MTREGWRMWIEDRERKKYILLSTKIRPMQWIMRQVSVTLNYPYWNRNISFSFPKNNQNDVDGWGGFKISNDYWWKKIVMLVVMVEEASQCQSTIIAHGCPQVD